jgi:hypothetical protein
MYIIDITSTHIVEFLTKQQPVLREGAEKIPK